MVLSNNYSGNLTTFLDLYGLMPTSAIAEAMGNNSDKTKSALELIVANDPNLAIKMIPNAFDDQTKLFSKEYFEDKLLPEAILNSKTHNVPFSYLIFDLDLFHNFNEQYGHDKGDEAISVFVNVLNSSFRSKIRRQEDRSYGGENKRRADRRKYQVLDKITRLPINGEMPQGRVGKGEEFAVIVYGCNELKAKELAERCLQGVRNRKIDYNGTEIGFTVSAGIAQYEDRMTPTELKKRADDALYQSKDKGRDRATMYSEI